MARRGGEKRDMTPPRGWRNPINVGPGAVQTGVDPSRLLPSRHDLIRQRLEFQRALAKAGQSRFTPILVTPDGVIVDGHHAVRAAVEEGRPINVQVIDLSIKPVASSILDLPIG
jgi:hypothetical protein